MVAVYGVENKKTGIPPVVFNRLLNTLPTEDHYQVLQKLRKEDRETSLLSKILLRYTLIREYQIQSPEVQILKGKYGKPFLKDNPNLYFNLSHSGSWIFLAVSKGEIGIDIEKERDYDLDIASNYFSGPENEYLEKLDQNGKTSAFFKIWTLKESYIKALGMGLYKPLPSFSVVSSRGKIGVQDSEYPVNNDLWTLEYHQREKGYHLAVCRQKNDHAGLSQITEYSQLIEDYLSGEFFTPSSGVS